MPIFDRYTGEAISLFLNGQEIVVTVVDAHDGKARIEIQASDDTVMVKNELIRQTEILITAPNQEH